MPGAETVMDGVVAPVDQVFPVAEFEVKVTGLLLHIIFDDAVMEATGLVTTINCSWAMAEQFPDLTNTYRVAFPDMYVVGVLMVLVF